MWNRSFRATHPSNSNSWRCENIAFLRHILQIPTVEDVKTKLLCETSFKFQQLKMWKRSFRARHPSNSNSWRCETEAFVRELLQIPTVEDVKTLPSYDTSFKFQQLKMWKRSFCARHPSNSNRCRCEIEAFVRETYFEFQPLKMWKRSFRARHPSNSTSWRCENEAFVRDILQIPTVEDVKLKLSCENSFKFQQLKMWKHCLPTTHPSNSNSWRCENQAFVRDILQIPTVVDVKSKLLCARLISNSNRWRCENEAFVPDILQIPPVEDVKTKLLCETSFKFQPLKMWNWSFHARTPSNSNSWRCENIAFLRHILQIPTVEDVKSKLLCARLISNSNRWRCENEAFVPNILQIPPVEDVKTKLLCETSFKFQPLKMWKRSSLFWHPFDLTSIAFDIYLLWHPLHWHPLPLTSIAFGIHCLWHQLRLTSLGFDISLLWHLKSAYKEVWHSNVLRLHITDTQIST